MLHRLGPVAVLAAAAVLAAGCATSISGTPQAAVTVPVSTSVPVLPTAPATSTMPTGPSSSPPPVPPTFVTTSVPTGPTGPTAPTGPTDAGTIGGVSVDSVLSDLAATGVALVDSQTDATQLQAQVSRARDAGLMLAVISVGGNFSDTDARNLADVVFDRIGGTVFLASPSKIFTRSDQLTDDQRQAATESAVTGKDDVEATRLFVDAALGAAGGGTVTTTSGGGSDVVNGVDVQAIANTAAKDGVAIQQGVTDVNRADFVAQVKSADGSGIKLVIFFLTADPDGYLYEVSDGVQGYTGGVVIGFSPSKYSISAGSDYSNDQLSAAIDAAANADTELDIVKAMIASLLKG